MSDLFTELYSVIMLNDAQAKCTAAAELNSNFDAFALDHCSAARAIDVPGLPKALQLVAPRDLKRRGIQAQAGRNILMHAIAHIEFNAINLALDAAYRFRDQPLAFYRDWISIAADEARHFGLIRDYLQKNNCDYGDFPVHNGLWEMAVQTADDVVARMALVPRVLEARGLDVTPRMIKRLQAIGDSGAVTILEVIYQDEIAHVDAGSRWFRYQCQQRSLDPKETFFEMIDTHLHGELKGPFNISARFKAGFDEQEINELQA